MSDEDTDEEEELDPRIKSELEKLNAATDGINHLETEFGEARMMFQQMMEDATEQLRVKHKRLGKSVEKARPYYDALKRGKQAQYALHQAAVAFEKAQSQHFVTRRRAEEVERNAQMRRGDGLDPGLQERLNQSTIELMDAVKVCTKAREDHQVISIDFEEKQKNVQELYKSLNKVINNARPYFELKMNLNKKLEVQKERLEKIQAGIKGAKEAYTETLANLEAISVDIHELRARRRASSAACSPRRGGGGGDSMPHSATLQKIKGLTLDDLSYSLSASTSADDIANLSSEGSSRTSSFEEQLGEACEALDEDGSWSGRLAPTSESYLDKDSMRNWLSGNTTDNDEENSITEVECETQNGSKHPSQTCERLNKDVKVDDAMEEPASDQCEVACSDSSVPVEKQSIPSILLTQATLTRNFSLDQETLTEEDEDDAAMRESQQRAAGEFEVISSVDVPQEPPSEDLLADVHIFDRRTGTGVPLARQRRLFSTIGLSTVSQDSSMKRRSKSLCSLNNMMMISEQDPSILNRRGSNSLNDLLMFAASTATGMTFSEKAES